MLHKSARACHLRISVRLVRPTNTPEKIDLQASTCSISLEPVMGLQCKGFISNVIFELRQHQVAQVRYVTIQGCHKVDNDLVA